MTGFGNEYDELIGSAQMVEKPRHFDSRQQMEPENTNLVIPQIKDFGNSVVKRVNSPIRVRCTDFRPEGAPLQVPMGRVSPRKTGLSPRKTA